MSENFDLTNNLILTIIKQFDSGKKTKQKNLYKVWKESL